MLIVPGDQLAIFYIEQKHVEDGISLFATGVLFASLG